MRGVLLAPLLCAGCSTEAPPSERAPAAPPLETAPQQTRPGEPPPPAAESSSAGEAPSRDGLGWRDVRPERRVRDAWRLHFPAWAFQHVEGTSTEAAFDLADAVNPFLIAGDFDGDGEGDVAAWVERRPGSSGVPPNGLPESGVLVVHRGGDLHFLGFGVREPPVHWNLESDNAVYVDDGGPLALPSDALWIHHGRASTLWYWDGARYQSVVAEEPGS